MEKPLIVISAINIFEGGPLSVLKDFLCELSLNQGLESDVIAFVHRKSLFNSLRFGRIRFIEVPRSRNNYIIRLFYEYIVFYRISKRLSARSWFSFHDITPRLHKTEQFVYCHNPSPFFEYNFIDLLNQPKLVFFRFFYKWVYQFNIKRNKYVIVQQQWIRKKFIDMYKLDSEKVIVSRPDINLDHISFVKSDTNIDVRSFIYPALPRAFKNIEVVCKCANMLYEAGITNFVVYLTISGRENVYSRRVYQKFKVNPNIVFTGVLPRSEAMELYSKVGCLIFPSRLETWGMPLSEFKKFKKPIIAANLDFAKETIGSYDKVKFFNPLDEIELYNYVVDYLEGRLTYDLTEDVLPLAPWSNTWNELLKMIYV